MSSGFSRTPKHFTYQEILESDQDLCQGDILQPTNEIRSLLAEVHPHFTDEKYVAFMLLTQTCDLVRRDREPCRSRYINLAVVRPLREILVPLLDRECEAVRVHGTVLDGVYASQTKYKARLLLDRILNQNAQAEGLFYLHEDHHAGIAVRSVALLQVSVAVRARDHYDKLVRARSGRLKEEFRSKLGWLTGNLFSRVATEDMTKKLREQIANELLEPAGEEDVVAPRWVPRESVHLANNAKATVAGLSRPKAAALLYTYRAKPPKEVAIERVVDSLRDLLPEIPDAKVNDLRKRLAADAVFESACK
jgi:hypothetical protein